jgi:hypothetical protein
MSYIPPHLRAGANNLAPAVMPVVLTIHQELVGRNWVAQAGNYFFPAAHPHIHIIVANGNTALGNGSPYRTVTMAAISNGQQHAGGGGVTFLGGNVAGHNAKIAALGTIPADAQLRMHQIAAAVPFAI